MKKLFIKQKLFKILDHYHVFDEFEQIHYNVDQEFAFFKYKYHVSNPFEQELFKIESGVFNLLPTFYISYTNGETITVQKRFTFLKTVIDVLSDDYDITLKGDFFDLDFTIYEKEDEIAHISKAISFRDSYSIDIFDEKYQDIIVSLVIIVDCIKDMRRNNERRN